MKGVLYRRRALFSCAAALAAMLSVSGCATYQQKVQATVDNSKAAIDAAKAAGAEQFAPQTIKSAEDNLAQAQQLLDIGKLQGAQSSAQRALADSQLAQEQAQTAKLNTQIEGLRQEIAALSQ